MVGEPVGPMPIRGTGLASTDPLQLDENAPFLLRGAHAASVWGRHAAGRRAPAFPTAPCLRLLLRTLFALTLRRTPTLALVAWHGAPHHLTEIRKRPLHAGLYLWNADSYRGLVKRGTRTISSRSMADPMPRKSYVLISINLYLSGISTYGTVESDSEGSNNALGGVIDSTLGVAPRRPDV